MPRNRFSAGFVVGLLATTSAYCVVTTEEFGDVSATLYAPSWTWQRQNVNLLIVLENTSVESKSVELTLHIDETAAKAFAFSGTPGTSVVVPANEETRHAFTDIAATSDAALASYSLAVDVRVGGETRRIPFEVRTIRGAAVSSSQWAALLPPALAALWCVIMIVVIRRFAVAGAWRRPGDPVPVAEHREAWIDAPR